MGYGIFRRAPRVGKPLRKWLPVAVIAPPPAAPFIFGRKPVLWLKRRPVVRPLMFRRRKSLNASLLLTQISYVTGNAVLYDWPKRRPKIVKRRLATALIPPPPAPPAAPAPPPTPIFVVRRFTYARPRW